MEAGFSEIVRDAVEGFVTGVGGRRSTYVRTRGVKVWFEDDSRGVREDATRATNSLQLNEPTIGISVVRAR